MSVLVFSDLPNVEPGNDVIAAFRELRIPDIKSPDGCQILLASGYNKPRHEPPTQRSHDCETRPIWTPWGWAVDRSHLTWLIVNWCFRNRKCFTCQFRSQYRRTRREVFPILSRIQNIGYDMGENGRTPEWYRANHRTPWVATNATATQEWVLAWTWAAIDFGLCRMVCSGHNGL